MLVFHCDTACALSLRWSMFFVPGSSASSWIISRLSPRFRAKCVLRGLYAQKQRVSPKNGWYSLRCLQYPPSWINWRFADVCCCPLRSTCGCFDASAVTSIRLCVPGAISLDSIRLKMPLITSHVCLTTLNRATNTCTEGSCHLTTHFGQHVTMLRRHAAAEHVVQMTQSRMLSCR